ncbi:MAG: hypothetical protein ACE5JA_00205 [bacterium]
MRIFSKGVMVVASTAIVVAVVALLLRFVFVSDQRRIEMTLKKAIEDVREERVDECMSHIAISRWDSTQATGEELRQIIEQGFAIFDNIRVLYDDFHASVKGNQASATVKIKVLAKYDDQVMLLVGSLTEGREIRLGLVKEGKKWLISSIGGVEISHELLEEL